MKFRIGRSDCRYSEYKPPCDGAFSDEKNKDGYPVCSIEINTLQDLIDLKNTVGEPLIIIDDERKKDLLAIKIYDDYREY